MSPGSKYFRHLLIKKLKQENILIRVRVLSHHFPNYNILANLSGGEKIMSLLYFDTRSYVCVCILSMHVLCACGALPTFHTCSIVTWVSGELIYCQALSAG